MCTHFKNALWNIFHTTAPWSHFVLYAKKTKSLGKETALHLTFHNSRLLSIKGSHQLFCMFKPDKYHPHTHYNQVS